MNEALSKQLLQSTNLSANELLQTLYLKYRHFHLKTTFKLKQDFTAC